MSEYTSMRAAVNCDIMAVTLFMQYYVNKKRVLRMLFY